MNPGSERFTRLWLTCGLLAPILLMVVLLVVGQITPDYDPLTQTISIMGIPGQPYAWVLNGAYLAYGVLMGVAAAGLSRSTVFPAVSRRAALLLAIHAAGTVLLGAFPDSTDNTGQHILHDAISALSYVPLLGGILVFRSAARQSQVLRFAGVLGLVIFAVNVPMPAVTMFPPLQAASGLLQRVLTGAAYCWLAGTFVLLYRKRRQL